MVRKLIAFLKIVSICLFAILALPLLLVSVLLSFLFGARARQAVVRFYTYVIPSVLVFLMGVKVKVHGKMDKTAGVLISNHLSYIDIPTLASKIGGVFVSRHDVKKWPLIGQFAQLGGTIFINRTSIKSAMESTKEMQDRIKNGARVIFCPEGKIGDGIETGKFKAFLFSAIAGTDIKVQPITILYTKVFGKDTTDESSKMIYWNDDTPLVTHAFRMLASGPIQVELHFHNTYMAPNSEEKEVVREYAEKKRNIIGTKFQEFRENSVS